jgi:hypothetical protein
VYPSRVVRGGLHALILLVAIGGCGDSSVLAGSELRVTGFGWYRLGALLLSPTTGCLAQASTTSYTLDGATIPSTGPCGALSADGMEDRAFSVGVRNGNEAGQAVVADMFPGRQATVRDPPGGKVVPGGDLTIEVPAAIQTASGYRAWFEYTDGDDPGYVGYSMFLSAVPSAEVHIPAPVHIGHFMLKIEMSTSDGTFPPGRIVSCSALAKCSARAAIDLGPLAIEVMQP